jgi:GNAT superfamily N-acetyltransferase
VVPLWLLIIFTSVPKMRAMKAESPVQIRRGRVSDAPEVASLLRLAFAEYQPLYTRKGYAWTTPGIRGIFARMRQGPLWVAVCEKRLVGTASAVRDETGIYLRGMAVLPETRGLGVGRQLLERIEAYALEAGAVRLYLSTTPFLDRAIRLYQAFGFHSTGEGPRDLFGTPLFTMEKRLRQ